MRAAAGLTIAALAVFLSGCTQSSSDIGRYQEAGKRDYPDGTEVYFLDTETGRICTAFLGAKKEEDLIRCTEPPE